MKKLIFSLGVLMLLTGCGTAELQDGTEAVTMFNEGAINAETLYDELKDRYGIEVLIDLIDTDLLEREYDKTDAETEYINSYVKSIKTSVKQNKYDLEAYISYYYGVKSVNELKEYFRLSYRRQQFMSDYSKTVVKDKEIETYYEDMTIGDITLSWILIPVDATSEDESDIKNKADAEALATAKEVIKKLDAGEKFADMAKKYSKDTATANNGGAVGKVNRGMIADNLIEEAIKLDVNKYSKKPIKTSEGYAILLVTAKDDKPEFNETTKSSIRETIAAEMVKNDDGTLYLESLEALRSKYSMTFKDSELSEDYTEYMNKQKNSIG